MNETLTTKQLPTLEQRMNAMLAKMDLHIKAVWKPDPSKNHSGSFSAERQVIEINAVDEHDAWDLFWSILEDKVLRLSNEVFNLTDGTIGVEQP